MKNVFDFQEQLSIGNVGEDDFVKYYKDLLPEKSSERKIDFILKNWRNETVELKTDTYDMNSTGNFFMETSGDINKGTLGGPWRAQQDKVTYFVYYYRSNKMFFWFKTSELCSKLDEVIPLRKLKAKYIKNKGWAATGFAVPRVYLEDVLFRKDEF